MSRSTFLFALAMLAALVLPTGCSSTRHYEEGYTQRGLASWYGYGSEGSTTADGEIFHKDALTAAHRHLPFGSMVRVTNLDTGDSVVVRINDRGPYGYASRIIDVSQAAANILHMRQAGMVRVELEVLSVGHDHYHRDE